jgi:transcription elongation GreA/GreB family factor
VLAKLKDLAVSRAFVKEIDEKPEEVLPRTVSSHPNYVTVSGLVQIEQALTKYGAAHQAALSKGNETAIELTAREIIYWSTRKRTAILVPMVSNPREVQFGNTVTVKRHDGRVQTFRIVGEDEAEPSSHTISYASPFAQAVLGKSVGDQVEIVGEPAEVLAIG